MRGVLAKCRGRRAWGVALLLAITGSSVVAGQEAEIRPWERAAVGLAMVYLDQGPAGWWERLAPSSPLRRLGKAAAEAAIEQRAGAPAGAGSWELQTVLGGPREGQAAFQLELGSGLDALLLLDFVQVDGDWQLADVRDWADPALPAAAEPTAPVPTPAPPLPAWRRQAALGGLGLGLLLAALSPLAWRRRTGLGVALLAGGLVVAGGGVAAVLLPASDGAGSAARAARGPTAGADLVGLARALSQPAAAERAEALFGELAASELAPDDEARLQQWQAHYRLAAGDRAAASRILAGFPAPSRFPLVEVLRGRLAAEEGNDVESALAYERLVDLLPPLDGITLEGALAMLNAGFEDRALEVLASVVAGGSRNGFALYLQSRALAFDGDEIKAARVLREAYEQLPLPRDQLVEDPVFVYLLRRGPLEGELALSQAAEPAPRPRDLAARALTLPAGFTARVSGRTLDLEHGRQSVVVPGGSALAPHAAVLEDAVAHRHRQEEQALAELSGQLTGAGGKAPPLVRQRLETALAALARRGRWPEILTLTEAFGANPQSLTNLTMQYRAEALRRDGREAEGTRLLIQLARRNSLQKRKDPGALFHLANFLLRAEQYDLALRVTELAEAQSLEPPLVSTVPRIRMEKQLTLEYRLHASRHFEVRYPPTSSPQLARDVADILEKELVRLGRWIPYQPQKPIEVDLFPLQDFFRLYSQGGEAIGLYDGKVRVPFGQAVRLPPFAVSVMSHEVAHALIAGATGDQAPSWFQEGLAQHSEMVQQRLNPIAAYQARGSLVTFGLLEPILRSHSDWEMVGVAYDEALWLLHYLETRHGVGAIHRLLAAFQRGLPTDEAVREVLGMSEAELDAAAWDWCTRQAPRAWKTEVIDYQKR